ncbi:MAG: hypothetical protein ISS69_03420 [Phycisphaerae bacterium]|nr:hypothetical protein [Phycisphaerae bacterium]
MPLVALLVALFMLYGCGPSRQEPVEQPETRNSPPATQKAQPKSKPAPFVPKPIRISAAGAVDFDINWPPRSLTPSKPSRRSLLTGQLLLRGDTSQKTDPRIFITLVLTRPHTTDADREFWNSETTFRQYKNWMPYVRGRDADEGQWLWPNLACLFKARGTERVERYGGWDRGHKADNDFGGVLIRKYDASGATESGKPLVSGDWRAVGDNDAGLFNVAHSAESNTFTLHPGDIDRPCRGRARVWFIYGDFMTWRPPWKYASGPMKGRPLKKEYAGGIIAQFRIDWTCAPGRPFEFTVTPETPRDDTGFDWIKWVARKTEWDTPIARPRLTDHIK